MAIISLFGEALDAHVREVGNWPIGAIVFAAEVIGEGDDPMILVTGGVPVGFHRSGKPKLGLSKYHKKAGILLSKYRELIAMRRGHD